MPKLLLIMTDGMRPDALVQAHTPTFAQLMHRGSYTLSARSVVPSMTLPCHMSLFHSVPPERHNVLTNTYTPMVRPVPGLFEVLKSAGKRSAKFFSWEPLRDVSRPGSVSVSKLIAYENNPEVSDIRVVETALPYLRAFEHDFIFLYLGSVDEVGHLAGWMSEPYLKQVEHLDGLIGQALEAIPSDTTVLCLSDHGGRWRLHGSDHPEDMTVPFFAMGPGIRAGRLIEEAVSLLEVSPTIAKLMGVVAPVEWEGKALELGE
jgi:hypothetical protein